MDHFKTAYLFLLVLLVMQEYMIGMELLGYNMVLILMEKRLLIIVDILFLLMPLEIY